MQTVATLSEQSDRLTHTHTGGVLSIRATHPEGIRVRVRPDGAGMWRDWDGRQEQEPALIEVRLRDGRTKPVTTGVYTLA